MFAQRTADISVAARAQPRTFAKDAGLVAAMCPHNAPKSTVVHSSAMTLAPTRSRTTPRPSRMPLPERLNVTGRWRCVLGKRRRRPQQILSPSFRLVIHPSEQFADDAGRDELNAHDGEEHPQKEQRPAADVMAQNEFVECEIRENRAADEAEREPEAAERMHRPVKKAQQERDPEEIDDHACRAVDPVLRRPECPRAVIDLHFKDAPADIGCKRGYETMLFAVEANIRNDLTPVCLQRATVVMQTHACHGRYQPVRGARWQRSRERVVLTVATPA